MEYTKTKFLMGTEITVTIFETQNSITDIEDVFNIFQSLEKEFSRFREDSSLSLLNSKRTLDVSDRFIDVFKKCKEIYADTNWYFNPLIDVKHIGYSTDFHRNEFKKTERKINLNLETIAITWNTISLQEDQNLDLWGIVKGYAVDRAREYLENKWYTNYIIDAGGDIYICGKDNDEKKILIGIDSPFIKGDIFATLEAENTAIATSWTYKRKRAIEGQEYNHILNPLTWKNNNEIISITLIRDDCYLADAYATACIAMWTKQTLEFLKKNNIDGIIICNNKERFSTKGMEKYEVKFM